MTAKIIQLRAATCPVKPRSAPDPKKRSFLTATKAHKAWLSYEAPFVAHTASLLSSRAWNAMSIHARRLIDLLEREHMAHAGQENGFLKLTRRQMQAAGISSDFISATITELETLGLLTVTHKGSWRGGARQNPSTYKLNYLPWKFVPAIGAPYYVAPTDEWQEYQGKTARPKSIRMNHPGGSIRHHHVVHSSGGPSGANQGILDPTTEIQAPTNEPHGGVTLYTCPISKRPVPAIDIVPMPLTRPDIYRARFVLGGKPVWASSPFPLSVTDTGQLVVHAAPPVREAA